jgi:hypothetical protein
MIVSVEILMELSLDKAIKWETEQLEKLQRNTQQEIKN